MRFSHFEDVSGVTIPQDKVRKIVPSGMVAHELLHTGQSLVTEGVKIDLCLDKAEAPDMYPPAVWSVEAPANRPGRTKRSA